MLPLQKQDCLIKPDHISIYVDNEDQQLHSLLQTAQLKVFLTITENQDSNSKLATPSVVDKDKSKSQNLLKASSIKKLAKLSTDCQSSNLVEHATLSTIVDTLHPKATCSITNEAKVLVPFLPGTSVDMKTIVKAEILVEQTLCDHIKVKERQPCHC